VEKETMREKSNNKKKGSLCVVSLVEKVLGWVVVLKNTWDC